MTALNNKNRKSLNLSIEKELIKKIKMIAITRNTTVSELVEDWIKEEEEFNKLNSADLKRGKKKCFQ